MLIATVSTIISLIFLIAFVAAMIILQVYLSRRESKLPGLVLPAITFSGELFILLNVVTNVVMTSVADNAVGGVDSYSVFVTVLNTVLTLLVISMPTIVGRNGVVARVPVSINDDEEKELQKSAAALKAIIEKVDFNA